MLWIFNVHHMLTHATVQNWPTVSTERQPALGEKNTRVKPASTTHQAQHSTSELQPCPTDRFVPMEMGDRLKKHWSVERTALSLGVPFHQQRPCLVVRPFNTVHYNLVVRPFNTVHYNLAVWPFSTVHYNLVVRLFSAVHITILWCDCSVLYTTILPSIKVKERARLVAAPDLMSCGVRKMNCFVAWLRVTSNIMSMEIRRFTKSWEKKAVSFDKIFFF